MADEKRGFEAFRPVIESQMAFMQDAMKFNVAILQAWLGGPAPEEREDERPSEACKKPEYMSP